MVKKIRFNVNDFEVGDRVVQPDDYDYKQYYPDMEVYFGTITSIESDGVKVHWDKSWMNTNHSTVSTTEPLYLEADWNQKQSALEQEFAKVADTVRAKLEIVKESLLDAKKFVSDAGYEFYHFRHDAMSPLEAAMEQFGWSTSSLYC